LNSIHIGGVRTGAKAKIIISGTTYVVGGFESETDLCFDGIRNRKLALKDKNGVVYLKSF